MSSYGAESISVRSICALNSWRKLAAGALAVVAGLSCVSPSRAATDVKVIEKWRGVEGTDFASGSLALGWLVFPNYVMIDDWYIVTRVFIEGRMRGDIIGIRSTGPGGATSTSTVP